MKTVRPLTDPETRRYAVAAAEQFLKVDRGKQLAVLLTLRIRAQTPHFSVAAPPWPSVADNQRSRWAAHLRREERRRRVMSAATFLANTCGINIWLLHNQVPQVRDRTTLDRILLALQAGLDPDEITTATNQGAWPDEQVLLTLIALQSPSAG